MPETKTPNSSYFRAFGEMSTGYVFVAGVLKIQTAYSTVACRVVVVSGDIQDFYRTKFCKHVYCFNRYFAFHKQFLPAQVAVLLRARRCFCPACCRY